MIRVERREHGCAWIVVDRPAARNAMTFAMWDALGDAARELDADESVRCVVVTGSGTQAFVAGTDIAEFRDFDGAAGVAYEARVERTIAALEALRVPAIAAIAGACTGGGVSIAGACDVRIGEPAMRAGIPIARTLGNCISAANLARLASLIGIDAAKRLIFTAALLDAPAALAAGLISEIAPSADALHARAAEVAAQLVAHAPLTLRATKELARRLQAARPLPPDDDVIRLVYGSADFREGRAAFLAKRAADFTGR